MKFQLLRECSEPLSDFSSLPPGGHVAVGCPASAVGRTGIALRRAGLEVRDSLVMLGPGAESTTVFLARKPLIGTVAENVLAHGCGVLNIDGCRISFDVGEESPSELRRAAARRSGKAPVTTDKSSVSNAQGVMVRRGDPKVYMEPKPAEKLGRWPANLILVHTAECVCEGTKRITGTGVAHGANASAGMVYGGGRGLIAQEKGSEIRTYADPDGKETVASWRCAPGCAVARLDAQTGVLKSGKMKAGQKRKKSKGLGGYGDSFPDEATAVNTPGDSGGSSRFFFQAASPPEAWAWIERLLTMPGKT